MAGIYVVLRQADVGSVEAESAFTDEAQADYRAGWLNERDGQAYKSWVEHATLNEWNEEGS
jgi:hypothetical protein